MVSSVKSPERNKPCIAPTSSLQPLILGAAGARISTVKVKAAVVLVAPELSTEDAVKL